MSGVDELDRAIARHNQSKQAERDARAALDDVIRRMIATGPRGTQADIVRRTGLSRETVRQIERAGTAPIQ